MLPFNRGLMTGQEFTRIRPAPYARRPSRACACAFAPVRHYVPLHPSPAAPRFGRGGSSMARADEAVCRSA